MLRNLTVLLFFFVICLTSCSKSTDSEETTEQLEISGTWTLTDQYGVLSMILSNSEFQWNRGDITGNSSIISFDNTENVLVMKHISHPDTKQLNKYMKLTWTPDNPTDTAYFCTYLYRGTQDSALAETVVAPSDYPRQAQRVN